MIPSRPHRGEPFVSASNRRLLPLAVFALALALRLALIALQYTDDLANFQTGDYTLYRIGGEHICAEGDTSNSLFLARPPLFPLLVCALGVDDRAVLVANAITGALLAPLTIILARQLRLGPRSTVAAGLIVALDPASIAYSAFLGAEPLANVTLLAMAVALLHATRAAEGWRAPAWGAAAGLALALSVLSRPAPYLIWTGLSVWLVLAYRRWAVTAAYALVSVAGIGAWIAHNASQFDNPTVSSLGAYNMVYYRAASVENWATDDDMSTIYANLARRVEERLGHDTARVDSNTRHTHFAGPAALTNAMMATAIETFTDHPAEYVMTIPIGLGRMYGYTNVLPGWLTAFEIPWNALLLIGTASGLWLALRGREWLLFWTVLLVIGYFTVGTIAVQTSGLDTRMRTMLAPFMAVAAVYALDRWLACRRAQARA